MITSLESRFLKALEDILPSGFPLKTVKVKKNNGAEYTALSSGGRDASGPAPLVYLEPFLRRAEEGANISDLAVEAAGLIMAAPPEELSVSMFNDFSLARDRVVFRLVNRDLNLQEIRDLPGRPWLDLYISYGITALTRDGVSAMTPVRSFMLSDWGVTEEELFQLASVNSPRLLPSEIRSFRTDFREYLPPEQRDMTHDIFFLTNSRNQYGASAILYPKVIDSLKKLAAAYKIDLFLIPSSIHEWIILFDGTAPLGAREIIDEVNRTCVAREEILGTEIYRLDAETGEIGIA